MTTTTETRKKLAAIVRLAAADPVAAQIQIEKRVSNAVARMRALTRAAGVEK